jgi:hypothetical protein
MNEEHDILARPYLSVRLSPFSMGVDNLHAQGFCPATTDKAQWFYLLLLSLYNHFLQWLTWLHLEISVCVENKGNVPCAVFTALKLNTIFRNLANAEMSHEVEIRKCLQFP